MIAVQYVCFGVRVSMMRTMIVNRYLLLMNGKMMDYEGEYDNLKYDNLKYDNVVVILTMNV
jgi:hypothetical protein